jgi:tripeptidyl-peptidase-1
LPSELLIDTIDYVDQFSELPNQRPAEAPRRQTEAVAYETATPSFLYQQYGVTEPTKAVAGSTSATVQFAPNWYSSTDLQTFFSKYVTPMVGQKVTSTFGVNGNAPTTIPSKPSVESNLDQQYIMGMGNFVASSIYYVVDPVSGGIEEGFVDYATYINNQATFPYVQSISYGQYGGQYTNSTVQRLTAELQMANTRGYSGFLASGDNGVGNKCSSGKCVSFEFDFPSSPMLTMVGATQFVSGAGEQGATLSAGGFSLDYYRPSWQNSAVAAYFASGVQLPPSNLYDPNGRGYPDIAAVGMDVEVVVNGAAELVGGTSCSSPISAGIFALLNNQRISSGKSPLGWLNPFIYANPGAFNDITVGNNQYCTIACCCQGFNATKGWVRHSSLSLI